MNAVKYKKRKRKNSLLRNTFANEQVNYLNYPMLITENTEVILSLSKKKLNWLTVNQSDSHEEQNKLSVLR